MVHIAEYLVEVSGEDSLHARRLPYHIGNGVFGAYCAHGYGAVRRPANILPASTTPMIVPR